MRLVRMSTVPNMYEKWLRYVLSFNKLWRCIQAIIFFSRHFASGDCNISYPLILMPPFCFKKRRHIRHPAFLFFNAAIFFMNQRHNISSLYFFNAAILLFSQTATYKESSLYFYSRHFVLGSDDISELHFF